MTPPRPTWGEPATGANRVPVPKQPVVLTANPNLPYMREWPEIRTKMELAKADEWAVKYETTIPGPWQCDVENEFGFVGSV